MIGTSFLYSPNMIRDSTVVLTVIQIEHAPNGQNSDDTTKTYSRWSSFLLQQASFSFFQRRLQAKLLPYLYNLWFLNNSVTLSKWYSGSNACMRFYWDGFWDHSWMTSRIRNSTTLLMFPCKKASLSSEILGSIIAVATSLEHKLSTAQACKPLWHTM